MPRYQVMFGCHEDHYPWCVYDMERRDCIAVCRTYVDADNIVKGMNLYESNITSLLTGD